MAAKRGKTQARRSGGGGNGGAMPGWAWLAIGAAIAFGAVFAYQRSHETGRDGFFRPTPNPDAQPRPASDDAVVEDEAVEDATAKPKPATDADKKKQDFDFYTLLPGKEVPMTDAEVAASEKAEQAQDKVQPDTATPPAPASTAATTPAPMPSPTTDVRPLPAPVDESAPKTAATEARPAPAAPAPSKDAGPAAETRYLLQAGAFQASGQAEELKAKIALLGLGARVESARIGGKTVYRVRMGPYGTAGELADAKRKLAAGGLAAMAVKTQ
ncbi:SPOR domain-containing protein [Cognatilysobacter segetis]|uniref:SPOR domain-containing protein n=1 Tax=Cognatilysobacter segetis TaxID=2492394 RepID=UPI00105E4D74|nr:SPOR domain-containing protein [Lysobacter segetis]